MTSSTFIENSYSFSKMFEEEAGPRYYIYIL